MIPKAAEVRLRGRSRTITPLVAVPGPVLDARTAGPDLGGRWPARLAATAAENRLSFPAARSATSFAVLNSRDL
jgi:hypothetical protein